MSAMAELTPMPSDAEQQSSTAPASTGDSRSGGKPLRPLDWVRLLRSAGGAWFAQAALHGELARVEWAEEKSRWLQMLAAALLGFAGLLSLLLGIGAAILLATWGGAYRWPALLAVLATYAIGALLALRRFGTLAARSDQSFAATRAELAADIALIKSKL